MQLLVFHLRSSLHQTSHFSCSWNPPGSFGDPGRGLMRGAWEHMVPQTGGPVSGLWDQSTGWWAATRKLHRRFSLEIALVAPVGLLPSVLLIQTSAPGFLGEGRQQGSKDSQWQNFWHLCLQN